MPESPNSPVSDHLIALQQTSCDVDACDSPHELSDNPSVERSDGAGEPCPTPLVWHEVLEGFLAESRPWEIRRGPHRLLGRTWGEGPPLYLLNNFASTAEMYSLLVWLLRDKFRCVVFDAVTPDLRSARQTIPTMSEFAGDLFTISDMHGDRRFTVYGSGFGAAVAIQAALHQPDRIDQMILQHGFARRPLSFFERTLASFCLRSGKTLSALPQRVRFQAVNHKPWFPPFDSSRFDFLVDSSGTIPLRDLARRAKAIHAFDVVSGLSEISCPVLLLRTEGEGQQAAVAQEILERNLKNARVEWMHSAGQHPCLTHPHRVAKLIQSFLGSENQ